MVNEPQDPERALVLSYASPHGRAALAALLALDDALGQLLRSTTQPALGQIRLAWWRDRLLGLDRGEVPAEPVLQALSAAGLGGAALVPIVDGWEVLIAAEALDEDALRQFGAERGGGLFAAAGVALGAGAHDPLVAAGTGWALADLTLNLSDTDAVPIARALADAALAEAGKARWSKAARSLGAMAHLARLDLQLEPGEARPIGAPRRVARLLWHRLSGR
jgi:15-cis-phytoene synthase